MTSDSNIIAPNPLDRVALESPLPIAEPAALAEGLVLDSDPPNLVADPTIVEPERSIFDEEPASESPITPPAAEPESFSTPPGAVSVVNPGPSWPWPTTEARAEKPVPETEDETVHAPMPFSWPRPSPVLVTAGLALLGLLAGIAAALVS